MYFETERLEAVQRPEHDSSAIQMSYLPERLLCLFREISGAAVTYMQNN